MYFLELWYRLCIRVYRSPHNLVANVLDCDIIISAFEFQSRCYVHFWTDSLRNTYIRFCLHWHGGQCQLRLVPDNAVVSCYNQTGNIATLDGASLKLVDKFTYLGSSVSSTEKDIDTRLTKAWTAIDRLSIIWKSDLTDKMKRSFFQAAVVSILLYGCTTWTLTKRLERRLDGNYTRMLRAVLNKSWRQHPTRLQLYGHLPPITKTIQVRRTRHAGHCWRSKDELISDVLLWTPTHGCARVGRPARTYIQQLCEDTGCNPEDLPEAMNDREKWRETVRDIRAGGATWWWWWWVLGKVRNPLSSSCWFNSTTTGLLKQRLRHWITQEVGYVIK